ncbi:MAG: hypothetical protein K2J76_08060 [Oscillospiraceae bacterium]|nr:hypothetical protein [Oscillospiraceae bacterium]
MKHRYFVISAIAALLLPFVFGAMAAAPTEIKPSAAVWIITGLCAVCGVSWVAGRYAGFGINPTRYFRQHIIMLTVSAVCYTVVFATMTAFAVSEWYIAATVFGLLSGGLFAVSSAVFLFGMIIKWNKIENPYENVAVWEYRLWLLINPNLYAMIFMICYVIELSAIFL